MSNTLVVNLFGGPGVGKSTNAALAFGKLKVRGYNAEYVPEFAKENVWEDRFGPLNFQSYIFGKQSWRVQRVIGKVDVVITDSPILLSLIYGKDIGPLEDAIVHQFNQWNTLNLHLFRNLEHHPYNPKGRTQTREEAIAIDFKIHRILLDHHIRYKSVETGAGEETANKIVEIVEEQLAT